MTHESNTFYAKDLVIEENMEKKEKPGDDHSYMFGHLFTDHMLVCDYDRHNGGWQMPKIQPFQDLYLEPSNATLHYSIECFEGAKAYKKEDDPSIVNMFRIDKNFERMNSSHRQLGFPEFNANEMIELTRKLIDLDKDWIPERPMHSIYIRPFSIAMDNKIGVNRINKVKTMVILSPVGPYYPRGFVPIKLYCDTQVVRAWPLGFGDKKIGGNYGPTIKT